VIYHSFADIAISDSLSKQIPDFGKPHPRTEHKQWPVADNQWPIISGQWPVAGGRWPMGSGHWPVAGG
jgi:hypothetical protein